MSEIDWKRFAVKMREFAEEDALKAARETGVRQIALAASAVTSGNIAAAVEHAIVKKNGQS